MKWFKSKIQKNYVSEADQFLKNFDANRDKLPTSRLEEAQKHQALFLIRDNQSKNKMPPTIWEGF